MPRPNLSSDDSGLTLVEIIIYSALSAVIAVIVTFMFINTLKGQENVTSVTTATTRGQVIAQSIDRAVRNALDVEVSGDGRTLKVLTTLDEPCQAWRVTDVGTIEVSYGAGFASWGVLATQAVLAEDHPRFFSRTSDTVDYAFALETAAHDVEFIGRSLPRTVSGLEEVTSACS